MTGDFIVKTADGDRVLFRQSEEDGGISYENEATTRDDVALAAVSHLKAAIGQQNRCFDAVEKVSASHEAVREKLIGMVVEKEIELSWMKVVVVVECVAVVGAVIFAIARGRMAKA